MRVVDLAADEVSGRLSGPGLGLDIPPFACRLTCPFPWFARDLMMLYADYPVIDPDTRFFDVELDISHPPLLKRLTHRQARFGVGGAYPFNPLPAHQAFPMFEWGLNWCVTNFLHTRLSFHAAAIYRPGADGGAAVVLPGAPGSGKSTLTAAAVDHGFELVSDELTLLDLETGDLLPVPRPISLKNASIDVIRHRMPRAVMNAPVADTTKGTVAHVRAPASSLAARDARPRPAAIVFPKFTVGAATELARIAAGDALMRLADQSFNFQIQGAAGFRALERMVARAPAWTLAYSNLDEALAALDEVLEGRA